MSNMANNLIHHRTDNFSSLPILDLSLADDETHRPILLQQLRETLFKIGFLYVTNHGVEQQTIDGLVNILPKLFDLPPEHRQSLSKLNSPHFLGYSGFAEETTLGKQDLREQFDYATELPLIWQNQDKDDSSDTSSDFTSHYWLLRGPNQWPPEEMLPGFRDVLTRYHDAVAALSYRFVHLVEDAFDIPRGTFDHFFQTKSINGVGQPSWLPPQHRIKLLKYPPNLAGTDGEGVGAHKDSSGWLTFLYQVGQENALEVLNGADEWVKAPPIKGTFVVNFGNAFEAATEGAVRATIHRVKATTASSRTRYSIPFFQGLPLNLTVSEVRSYIPENVRSMRGSSSNGSNGISTFLDPRWDNLGESQLRKWIRSHPDVGRKWYGEAIVDYYIKT